MSTAARTPEVNIGVVFGALMSAMLLAALDQTIVATALPTIVGDLGGREHYSWVVTSYLLATTVSTPLYGKLGDLYGRKRLFQAAIVLFLVGSALCGLSQSMLHLIGFRALQGLGGGGLIVGAQAIIADVVSPRDRGRYQGFFGAVFGVASVAGPLIGGFFVDHGDWRWVFYVNLPVGVVALIAVAAALPATTQLRRPKIDYLGAALLGSGLASIILLTSWGGNEYDWGSPMILGLALAAAALLWLFTRVENHASEPLLPLELFRNPIFVVSCAVIFVVGFALLGTMTFLPQYLQMVRGSSATESGLQLVPMMAGVLPASILSGQLISRFGRYKIYPVVGMAVTTCALLMLSRLALDTDATTSALFMFTLGVGLGLTMQTMMLAVQNAVEMRHVGTATSSVTLFRSVGGALGVALFGAVFNAVMDPRLQSGKVFDGSPEQLAKLPEALKLPFLESFVDAIDRVFLVAAPIALLGLGAALFLRETPLRRTTGGLAGASQGLGLPHVGAADAMEEADLRVFAAESALDKLDELTEDSGVDEVWVERLRALLTDRLAYLAEAQQRWRLRHEAGEVSLEGWGLLVEGLRVERASAGHVESAPSAIDGVAGIQCEAELRITAARAALARVDQLAAEHPSVSPDVLASIRGIFVSRIVDIAERAKRRVAMADDVPEAYWALAIEVLETERQELAGVTGNEASAPCRHRVQHDLEVEASQLAGT